MDISTAGTSRLNLGLTLASLLVAAAMQTKGKSRTGSKHFNEKLVARRRKAFKVACATRAAQRRTAKGK